MRRLVEGEVLQLSLRGSFAATEQDYFDVVKGKTASLFGWSAAAGAWAAGVRGEIPEALVAFGEGIGTAFQLVDDALDYEADPALLGKRLGQDFAEGKATLPLIRAFQREPALRDRLRALVAGELDGAEVAADVIEVVRRTGGVEAARAVAREHTVLAMEALSRVPDGPHRRAMADAARSLTDRES
jgi:octaprenyl-diphosphate synthase